MIHILCNKIITDEHHFVIFVSVNSITRSKKPVLGSKLTILRSQLHKRHPQNLLLINDHLKKQ